jgi:hypothetical protein
MNAQNVGGSVHIPAMCEINNLAESGLFSLEVTVSPFLLLPYQCF